MHKHLWRAVGGVFALALIVLGVSQLPAQRAPAFPGFAPPPGRFVVANASYGTSMQIVVLDTATGQLYAWTSKDFRTASDLPRLGERLIRPPFMDRGDREIRPDRDCPPRRDKDRDSEKEKEKDPHPEKKTDDKPK